MFKEYLNQEKQRLTLERERTFTEPNTVVAEVRERLSDQLVQLSDRSVTNGTHISMYQYIKNLIKECDENPNLVLEKERNNYDILIASIDEDERIFNDDGEII